mmetsp:Transcript_17321/g.52087  ORF Transcript_17321/g.52087 Transcript_17321/m.52087 type:complete len:203 (-) Transcript_17321:1952-2560(-)
MPTTTQSTSSPPTPTTTRSPSASMPRSATLTWRAWRTSAATATMRLWSAPTRTQCTSCRRATSWSAPTWTCGSGSWSRTTPTARASWTKSSARRCLSRAALTRSRSPSRRSWRASCRASSLSYSRRLCCRTPLSPIMQTCRTCSFSRQSRPMPPRSRTWLTAWTTLTVPRSRRRRSSTACTRRHLRSTRSSTRRSAPSRCSW